MDKGTVGADRRFITGLLAHGETTMDLAITLVFGMLVTAPVYGYWRAMLLLSDLMEEADGRPGGFTDDRMGKAG